MGDNIHEGHRQRLKREFLNNGIDEKTPPHKILELLLFFCIQRSDTNPLAHELIEKFGSIAGVLDAPIEELTKFKGLTESNAILLKMIIPISRLYYIEKGNKDNAFLNIDEVGEFLIDKYRGFTVEKFSILTLDATGKKLSFDFLSEGDIDKVGISTRQIMKYAINANAVTVIIAHNHPGGTALPSATDIKLTRQLKTALSHAEITLLDHIVISNDDYVSMAQSREYEDIFPKAKKE